MPDRLERETVAHRWRHFLPATSVTKCENGEVRRSTTLSKSMVGVTGFEPATSTSQTNRDDVDVLALARTSPNRIRQDYRVRQPQHGDSKKSRWLAVVRRQDPVDSKANRVLCAPIDTVGVSKGIAISTPMISQILSDYTL
jgi:hypothetical protein